MLRWKATKLPNPPFSVYLIVCVSWVYKFEIGAVLKIGNHQI